MKMDEDKTVESKEVEDNSGKYSNEDKADVLEGETCPICGNKTLILMETQREIPYFGKVYLFSMGCNSCKYHKADVEAVDTHEPCKYTFNVKTEEDLKVRVVKSSWGKVIIPRVMTIEPGEASNGYITNIEGILTRVKNMLESVRDTEEDEDKIQKAKNQIKKINKVLFGQEEITITIEDPSGNSAIISDKAEKKKL